jgi:hypothetical protein
VNDKALVADVLSYEAFCLDMQAADVLPTRGVGQLDGQAMCLGVLPDLGQLAGR